MRRFAGRRTALLTWKGAPIASRFKERVEYEVEVSDPDQLSAILGRLGFRTRTEYPKRRESFLIDGAKVALDELPFGHYCEIEGNHESITHVADRLGLSLAATESRGYAALMRAYIADSRG